MKKLYLLAALSMALTTAQAQVPRREPTRFTVKEFHRLEADLKAAQREADEWHRGEAIAGELYDSESQAHEKTKEKLKALENKGFIIGAVAVVVGFFTGHYLAR